MLAVRVTTHYGKPEFFYSYSNSKGRRKDTVTAATSIEVARSGRHRHKNGKSAHKESIRQKTQSQTNLDVLLSSGNPPHQSKNLLASKYPEFQILSLWIGHVHGASEIRCVLRLKVLLAESPIVNKHAPEDCHFLCKGPGFFLLRLRAKSSSLGEKLPNMNGEGSDCSLEHLSVLPLHPLRSRSPIFQGFERRRQLQPEHCPLKVLWSPLKTLCNDIA